jgi:hypothetical protein
VCLNNNVCVGGATKGQTCSDTNGPLCTDGGNAADRIYIEADYCLNGKCGTEGTPLGPGDSCSTSDTLIESASTTGGCAGTTCVNGVCDALQAGENCTGVKPCVQGYYCSVLDDPTVQGTCVALKDAGAACTSSLTCKPNLNCMGTSDTSSKTCTALFSVASGSYCDGTFTAEIGEFGFLATTVCNKGLTCVSSKCADPKDSTAGKGCSVDADCDGGAPFFSCVNDPCDNKAVCVPLYLRSDKTLADDYEAFVDCLASNNCGTFVPWNSGTGGGQNCADKNCISSWTTWRDDLPFSFGGCGAAAGLVPLAFLAVAGLVLALLL